MKQKWDKETKKALILYRLSRAEQALGESLLLADEGYYNTAMNRLYYACFYASTALLLKNDIQTQTHTGVKTMIAHHFISKGIIPQEIGKTLSALFERRQSGDYDDFAFCDQREVANSRAKAVEYVEFVKALIQPEME